METKEIKLTQGKSALVDLEDFVWISRFRWYAVKTPTNWYAVRAKNIGGKIKTIPMHRSILSRLGGVQKKFVDHINRNGLDNRRENLRWANPSENGRNRAINRNNTSGARGIYKHRGKWTARIQINGTRMFLGSFPSLDGAKIAVIDAARTHYGSFMPMEWKPRRNKQ